MLTVNSRTADHKIDPIFLERWSPRAFNGEPISDADLHVLFEAARWAPSSYNSQPWRFLYARRDTPNWPKFLGLLNEFNQGWAKNAAAIVVLLSKKTMLPPGADKWVPSHSHSLDAGAAWSYLALQGARSGFITHAMVGIDLAKTATELKVPEDDYRVEMAFAIGKQGDKSILPEALQAREVPNSRNPQAQFCFEGDFPG